ncbi:MAG: hypothetical protein ACRC6J_05660 [Cetobacterium sp.]
MVDFKKIDNIIDYIEAGTIPENKSFNEFAVEFYLETKTLTLSKYLRLKEKTSKMPKIMNTKKAGELLFETNKNEEVKSYLSRKGFKEIPELNYTAVMLLRKVELLQNWQKIIFFFEGGRTIQEINSSLKKDLLPMEVDKLEKFIKEELRLSDQELNWFLGKIGKVEKDKALSKAVKKLIR